MRTTILVSPATPATPKRTPLRDLDELDRLKAAAYAQRGKLDGFYAAINLLGDLRRCHEEGAMGASETAYHVAAIAALSSGLALLDDAKEQALIDFQEAVADWRAAIEKM